MMAAYNAGMNRRVYAAAARLDDAARRQDRGAFFGSIHATLNHLLWADRMWMARFANWPKPDAGIAGSVALFATFDSLAAGRDATGMAMCAWAADIGAAWLAGDLSWYSGALQCDVTRPVWVLVTHLFNHQTHHCGQVHAMLTQAGESTGDTDLFAVVEF